MLEQRKKYLKRILVPWFLRFFCRKERWEMGEGRGERGEGRVLL